MIHEALFQSASPDDVSDSQSCTLGYYEVHLRCKWRCSDYSP